MRSITAAILWAGLYVTWGAGVTAAAEGPAGLQACSKNGQTLGVSRLVEIDTSTGALFGSISTQVREARFLEPKEVVLTFDDGPMPSITRSILDTLDRFCTKATFFAVGRMAVAYPSTVKNMIDRGHTVGSHTWSHPLNLKRLPLEKAKEEIEKGHAAVTLAAGQPVAPFFRFPGLSDSAPMLHHLQARGIAAFTVDAVSNDSYISDPDALLARILKEVEHNKGGIVLFHDIKPATARMLPRFLSELQARGYRIVHMRSKGSVEPVAEHAAKLAPLVAKAQKAAASGTPVPLFGLVRPGLEDGEVAVTAISPAARDRSAQVAAKVAAARATATKVAANRTAVRGWTGRAGGPGAWGTVVVREK